MHDDEFAGQAAVVTGAARGLGRVVSALLAARGATVFMADVDGERVEAAAAELAGAGGRVLPHRADVTDEGSLRRLREEVLARAGRVDVLVNNAGGWRYAGIREITAEDWDWTFATNLKSVLLASRTFMDDMVAARYGRIVNVASNDAYVAKPNLAHYAAAKAAVVSLTKSLAAELAPHQVLVNAVSPGAIATETAKSQDWLPKRIAMIPVGRAAEPEDISEVILFLASRRNRFLVGETVVANGGMLML
jgi:3-oxoacyl-[acyl-carrier protein] reductase